MTTIPVTDIPNDYSVTAFSEDGYPSNKNYEITTGQLSILRTVNDKLLAKTKSPSFTELEIANSPDFFIPGEDSPITIIEHVGSPQTKFIDNSLKSEIVLAEKQRQQRVNIRVSGLETVIEKEPIEEHMQISSIPSKTPSLGVMFDKDKRIKLLEDEICELKTQQSKLLNTNNNLDNFTKLLFGKNIHQSSEINKRIAIVNYASLTKSELTLEDLEICSEEEIDKIYKVVKQHNDSYKKRIIVTHFITIIIIILEQILVKLGFEEMKGVSNELTSEIIDLNIGEDCEAIAVKIGIVNSPIINIVIFLIKKLMTRIKLC
ncbi:viral membrane formation protein [Goatpox virus]|uniref:Viral membrane formation protein n=1 Tax=Goatpox virus TaxID=186805 RepID=A0A5C0PRF0_9POXV|nr:viral membrane formation protein [Goatpox virus]QOK36539.1 viral membrane formation protein [Goatpox virus]